MTAGATSANCAPNYAPNYAHCESLLREGDRDRWLASLFIPADQRAHAQALYAFSLEVAGISARVSEAMLGEIRLQWWREILVGERQSEAAAHPVASALRDTIARCDLSPDPLLALLDARLFDLYKEPIPTLVALEAYAKATASNLFHLAAQILARGMTDELSEAAVHAGIAYALTGLLRAFAWHRAHGQLYVPLENLAAHGGSASDLSADAPSPALLAALADLRHVARGHLQKFATLAKSLRGREGVAFLPARLCEAYLRQMEKKDYDPFRTPIELPQWRRQWILWRAARALG